MKVPAGEVVVESAIHLCCLNLIAEMTSDAISLIGVMNIECESTLSGKAITDNIQLRSCFSRG